MTLPNPGPPGLGREVRVGSVHRRCGVQKFRRLGSPAFPRQSGVELALDAAFRAAMLMRMPLAFIIHLQASVVGQQVQRLLEPAMEHVGGQGPLVATAC